MPWDVTAPGCFDIATQITSVDISSILQVMCQGFSSAQVELNEVKEEHQALTEDVCYLQAQSFCKTEPANADFSYDELAQCFSDNEISKVTGRKFIKSLLVPANIEKLSKKCFSGCEALSSIRFMSDSNLNSIGEKALFGCIRLKEIVIPANVEVLCRNCFSACSSLSSVRFENESCLKVIEEFAFSNCTSLKEMKIPDGVEIRECVFSGTDVVGVLHGTENSLYFMTNRKKQKKIEFPANVEIVCAFSFNECVSLACVRFAPGSRLKRIEQSAFSGCKRLRDIEIPENVEIGDGAFSETGATGVHRGGPGNALYFAPNGKKSNHIEVPATVQILCEECFSENESLTSVRFLDGSCLKRIELIAFSHCVNLKEIEIPASVELLGGRCFGDCRSLSSVRFASGSCLQVIDSYAFANCYSLSHIVIPASVVIIGQNCFSGCNSLETVHFSAYSSLMRIYKNTFNGCRNLRTINLPDKEVEIV